MTSFQRCEVLITDPRTGRTRKSVALGPKWIVVHEWFTSTKSPLVSSKFTHDSRRHQRAFELGHPRAVMSMKSLTSDIQNVS